MHDSLPIAATFALLLAAPLHAQCDGDLLLPPDPQPEHFFAFSLAVDGPLAVAGAQGDDDQGDFAGSVHVLEQRGGAWSVTEELYASDAAADRYFGREVALSGEHLVALSGATERLHVFERSAGVWSEVATIDPPPAFPASDWFGDALALEDDLLVVGDWGNTANGTWSGVVHVYRASAGAWALEDTLTHAQAESGDRFGYDVSVSNGRVLVGAPGARTAPVERRGAGFVFERVAGAWTETAFLPGDARHDGFGWSAALSGDTAVLGAPFGPGNGDNEGGAIVLDEVAGSWSEVAHLSSGTDVYTQYGNEVALDGDRLTLLAPGEAVLADPSNQVLTWGVAYLFERGSGGWDQVGRRTGRVGGSVGYGLALDGDRLLVRETAENGVHTWTFGPHLVTSFCFCDVAGCHNEDPLAGCKNATGVGAHLAACGSTSVSQDDLVLAATDVVPQQFSILIMGRDAVPRSYFGNGWLCIGDADALRRYHVEQATSGGRVDYGPGIVNESLGFPPSGQILAGATWCFQLWYRDPGACGTGSNATNALAVTFAD